MESQAAVTALSALAQSHRLAIFRLLVARGPTGACAGEIAESLDIPSPTLSFHLATLRHAGLIQHRRQGRSMRYSARFDAMNALLGYLTENCCGDNPRACLEGPAVAEGFGDNTEIRK